MRAMLQRGNGNSVSFLYCFWSYSFCCLYLSDSEFTEFKPTYSVVCLCGRFTWQPATDKMLEPNNSVGFDPSKISATEPSGRVSKKNQLCRAQQTDSTSMNYQYACNLTTFCYVCSCLTQNYVSALKLNPNWITATCIQSLTTDLTIWSIFLISVFSQISLHLVIRHTGIDQYPYQTVSMSKNSR